MEENAVNSAICTAVQENNLATLQLLLTQGNCINFKNEKGCTPLHLAMNGSSYRHGVLNILLKQPNSPINIQDSDGSTCLYLACKKRLQAELIKDLLDHGADPNIANLELRTPIQMACQNKNLNLVKVLHEYGADLNAQNIFNNTPLHCAIQAGAKKVIKYLLDNNVDTSLKGSLGYNAFMWAMYCNQQEFIDMILPFTSDLNAVGKRNDTAFDLAIELCNMRVVEILIDRAPESILCKIENLLKFTLRAGSHLRQLNVVLRTPNLSSVLKDSRGIFRRLFSFNFQPRETFFRMYKSNFVILVTSLIHHKIKLDNNDLIAFMIFFKYCPYRMQLLEIAVKNLYFKVHIKPIRVAFSIKPEFGIFLLQNYVPRFNCCIYDDLIVSKTCVNNLNYLFPLFTPKCSYAYRRYVRDKYQIKPFQKCFVSKVPSLKEISRDMVRKHVGNMYRAVPNKNKDLADFPYIVKRLDVPTVVKDILMLKKPVTDLS